MVEARLPVRITALFAVVLPALIANSVNAAPAQIVYQSNEIEGLFTDLFIINEDGTGKRQLTSHPGSNDFYPVFSPDGQRVAFSSDRDGNGDLDIYAIDVDDGTITQLTHDPGDDLFPDFSPDGETIIFQSNRDHLCGHDNCDMDIYAMNAWTGQNVTRLTGAPGDDRRIDQQPAYFPNGEKVVFSRTDLLSEFGTQDLWTLGLTSQSETQLTFIGRSEGRPTVSPDGTEVAFQGGFQQENDAEVLIVSVTDGTVRKVTDNSTFPYDPGFQISDGSPSWSLNSDRIVYHSDTDNQFNLDLYIINSDGTGRQQLTTNGGVQDYPNFGPPADPTSRSDCKSGGWEAFGFRNQGQCVRFVNTGFDSR